MNFNNDFRFDLEFGQLDGETWFHDLVSNKKIEVKSDRIASITGNIYIEYYSRGKLSGIATTQSDFYVYKVGKDEAIIISTSQLKKKLKQLVREGKALKDVKGGDNNTSTGILCKIKDLIN
jgi:hypothetical protein